MPYTNIDKLGEQYLKFAKATLLGSVSFEQRVDCHRFCLKAFTATGKVMTNETGWHYYTEVANTIVLELMAIEMDPNHPEVCFVFTYGKNGEWVADYPTRYRNEGMPVAWAVMFSILITSFAQYLTEMERVVDEQREQEIINRAFSTALDFSSVTDMLLAVPADKRLPVASPYQDHVNHAFAVHKGFDNTEALLASVKVD